MQATDRQTEALTIKVQQLVRTSRSSHEAGAELCALGADAISLLCSLVQAERKRRDQLVLFFAGVSVLSYTIILIIMLVLPRENRQPYQMLAMGTAGTGLLGTIIMTQFGGRATRLLARLDDVRVVGPLLDSLEVYNNNATQKSLRQLLTRLLLRLQASDASGLLPRHISALNRELDACCAWKWGASAENAYALILFKALEQVGDETSVPSVEKALASAQQRQVREAAKACLPFLQARTAMGKHTLLRAASSDTAHLLLAAQSEEEQDPNGLLRSVSTKEMRA